jgi:hypothetical protein
MRKISSISIVSLLFCLGCGGSAPPPTTTATEGQSADDTKASTASLPSREQSRSSALSSESQPSAKKAQPVGPASVTIDVTVKGKPAAAAIQLLDEGGKVTAEGKAGEKIITSSGKYDAVVQVTDTSALVDKPTKHLAIALRPGQDAKEQMSFPWARIRLNVKIDGRLDAGAVVNLLREGAVVASVKSADQEYVQISPGRYQAEVNAKNTKTMLNNVMFPEGATQDIPVDVRF